MIEAIYTFNSLIFLPLSFQNTKLLTADRSHKLVYSLYRFCVKSLFIMIITEMDESPQDQEPSGDNLQIVKHEKPSILEIKTSCTKFINTLQSFNSHVYHEFVDLMRDFTPQSNESLKALTQKLKELFKGRPEFIRDCNAFLPLRHQITMPRTKPKPSTENQVIRVLSRKRKRHHLSDESPDKLEEMIDFTNMVAERFYNPSKRDDLFRKFLEVFDRRRYIDENDDEVDKELKSYKEVIKLFKGHPDMIEGFLKILPTLDLPALFRLIDYSTCEETCTPSYRLIPKFLPIHARQRSILERQVLNDELKSAPSISLPEGKTVKPKATWEDHMFEADLKLGHVQSTLESIRVLKEKIEKDDGISEIYLEDYFNEMNWRCIEKCYADQKLKAMHELRKNNNLKALPLLMRVLKQQEDKLDEERSRLYEKRAAQASRER